MWKVKNQSSEVAEIYIHGLIVDDEDGVFINEWIGDSTGYEFPKKLREQLDEVKDKELEVHINSNGGSVLAGLAMANFIANHKKKTVAIVDGIAGSIATQIFFSADICKMPTNSYLVVHKPFCEVMGDADEMRKAAETLDVLQEGLETTYQKRALEGVTADKIHALVDVETWLTGEDAAKLFTIEVINPLKAVNCIGDYKRYKNKPKNLFEKAPSNVEESDREKADKSKRIELLLTVAKAALL